MLPIDRELLFICKCLCSSEPQVIQDCLEFILIRLKFREALLGKNRFIFPRDRIIIRVTEKEIGELLEHAVFQFGRNE